MPYVDPQSVHNPATGTAAPAAWGDQVRADLEALYGSPSVRASRSVAQSIPDATLTAITFDTETYDTHAMHSTVSNTSRLTIPANWDGLYLVGACIHWQNNGLGRRHIEIQLNGSLVLVEDEVQQGNNGECQQAISTSWQFTAADYIEVHVYQDWGSTLNVETSGYAAPVLWAAFMRGPTSSVG